MMKVAIFQGKGAITLGERPDPTIKEPTDALVRVVLACVCGSDLWFYRGESDAAPGSPIGHEFLGVVEQVGKNVQHLAKGDLVIAPFLYTDGTCPHCQAGITSACVAGGMWGVNGIDGAQGEAVRVPLADGTLVKVPGRGHSDETLASLLTLSDVMCTGHHAARSAGVKKGDTVAVVGDGAVGLCAILAAKRLGAERIIALSRNPVRTALARAFGATDILAARGAEASAEVLSLTDEVGVDAALECVGTNEAMQTALSIARPGSIVGYVGMPHGVEVPVLNLFFRNVGVHGGLAPARAYIPELLGDVLAGRIHPGRVFDFTTDLSGIAQAYAVMDERRAIKSLVKVGTI
jgi:threonine dehydrogenase-like Zn-dependent dehydrogenase